MSAPVYLLVVLALTLLGSIVVYVRNRAASSVESGIDSFHREMRALAPRGNRDHRRRSESRTEESSVHRQAGGHGWGGGWGRAGGSSVGRPAGGRREGDVRGRAGES